MVEIASVQGYLDTSAQEAAVLTEIASLQREGIARIVICGAAMAGLAARLQPKTGARLFDGIACAVAEAERLVRAGEGAPKPRDPLVRSSTVTGVSPALEALFKARNAP